MNHCHYQRELPKDPQQVLWSALQQSQVITAWHEERLVGLVRGITDQQTILYIQDLLVLQEFQRQGIGQTLVNKLVADYPTIRQKVLLTDDTEKTRAFYEACGFQSVEKMQAVAFLYSPKKDN